MKKISGYEEVKDLFGYFPTFHDDLIEKLEICNDKIIITICMETNPNNIDTKIKIRFVLDDLVEFKLEGDGYLGESIIFEIELKEYNDYIKVDIDTMTGISGVIKAEKIKIEMLL